VSLRFHDAERRLTLSVHDCIDAGPARGHLRAGASFGTVARMRAGQQVHTDYQAWRSDEDEHFKSEVAVEVRLVVREWEVLIRGRVDGITQESGRLVVEEIKSTAMDEATLANRVVHDWPAYEAQVALYRFLLHAMGQGDALGRLVMVSLVDASQRVFLVDEPLEETEAWLRGRLEWVIRQREARISWMARRRAAAVPFAHETTRQGQQALIEHVHEAVGGGRQLLLSAPTGVGKTAAVLHGVLTQAYKQDLRVFVATAKGTQQRVAEDTLSRIQQRGLPLRAVTLTAREKACLNEVVDCRPEACRYAEAYFDRVEPAVKACIDKGVSRPTDLGKLGRALQLCPFELALDASEQADVVVGDFNYAMSPSATVRRHFDQRYKDWVLVVDEAHNLPERARSWWSPELRAEAAHQAAEALSAEDPVHFAVFIELCAELARAIEESSYLVEDGAPRSRDGREALIELAPRVWTDLADRFDEVSLDYQLLRRSRAVDEDLYQELSREVARFSAVLIEWKESGGGEELASLFRVERGPSVKLVCLDPSPWLGKRLAGFGALVLMSATLTPSRFYVDLLGLDPERVEVRQHGSPFPPENRGVLLGTRVSTAYRDRAAHRDRTAELIARIVEATPGNVAVYYSAFSMLRAIAPLVQVEHREPLIQEPRMSEEARLGLVDELRALGPHKTLHGVLGGIFSEGIDLPGGILKTVVLVGPALPQIGLERDLMRDWFQRRYGDGFGYAFLVPGMSKVVQAAGRVVRGPGDRGCVVLLGRRFGWREYRAFFPDFWHPEAPQDPALEVARFWAAGPAGSTLQS
jgi:DNA excision repair protein ERCC-2